MKKLLILGLAALATTGVSKADYSLSLDLSGASEYIFRGMQLGDATLHSSIELTKDDFYIGMWTAMPQEKLESMGYTNEFDFYVGYTKELSDKTSIDLGATYYYYPDSNVSESTELYLGVTFDVGGFTPAVYTYYDWDNEVFTLQGSVGYSVPMAGAGTSLDLTATYGYVSPDIGESYSYYGASAQIPYKLNENATLTVGAHYAANDTKMAGTDKWWLYYTAGVTIGF
jgi:uncharacterized protein (TIGR02001 family)